MAVQGVIKEHIQEDAQQKNTIPDMIWETAGHFRHVTLWTDSLEPSPFRSLDGKGLFLTGRLQLVRGGPNPKETKCRTSSSNWCVVCGDPSK